MPLRSIPPITMSKGRKTTGDPRKPLISIGFSTLGKKLDKTSSDRDFSPHVYRKPKTWSYITKPIFKRINEPYIDVFVEAEEVWIIIDLGIFRPDEIEFCMRSGKYVVTGRHNEQEFKKEIELPTKIDIHNIEQHYKGGILELKLRKLKEKDNK